MNRARTFGVILLLGLLAFALAACGEDGNDGSLPDQVVVPNFDTSYPIHGEVLKKPPGRIDINFKLELQEGSSFSVLRDGEPVSVGEIVISQDPWLYALSMGASIETGSDEGVYQVDFLACWEDGSCNDGTLAFIVDSTSTQ